LLIHHVSSLSGGAERYLFDLVGVLEKKYKVFFVSQESGPLPEALNKLGVFLSFQKFPPFRRIKYFLSIWIASRRLIKFCRLHDIHLICSNSYRVTPYAVIAAKALKIPSMTIIHDFVSGEKLDKFCVFDSDLLITVSNSISNEWRHLFKRAIVTIYNGLDILKFIQAIDVGKSLREEYGIPVESKIVGMVGNFAPVKGHRLFLESMNIVQKSFPHVVFVVVGDSLNVKNLNMEDLKNFAQEIGLEDRIIFTGYRSDVGNILKSFDVLVLPSSRESFGRVVMEAMALGIAVVATDSGGPAEIIENGVCGVLTPIENGPRLAQEVLSLLNDDHRRKELGDKGIQRVKECFSPQKTYFRFNQIFDVKNEYFRKLLLGNTR